MESMSSGRKAPYKRFANPTADTVVKPAVPLGVLTLTRLDKNPNNLIVVAVATDEVGNEYFQEYMGKPTATILQYDIKHWNFDKVPKECRPL